MTLRTLVAGVLGVAIAGCGGGDDSSPPPAESATFVFRLRNMPGSEEFRVASTSATFIAQARAQLSLPELQRQKFVSGAIRAGGGGHNTGWSWHFSDAALVDATIELCDGKPSFVEADLNYWLNTVGRFCPWSSYAYAEVR